MKTVVLMIGVAVMAMGLLWIGQGLGLVHWPKSSFMLDQRQWAVRGAVLAVIGVLLVIYSRKRNA